MTNVRVWDLPTRLFHWALALTVVALVVTAKLGGSWMNGHLVLGHVVLALLAFRVLWGFAGGRWSRFSAFFFSPGRTWAYLRGQADSAVIAGHSPLGALSVFAMLLVLAIQVGTGLMSDDEIAFFGSLVAFVPSDWVSAATRYHRQWGEWLVLGMVALHVLAIAFYAGVRREPLVKAMITGDKPLPLDTPASRDGISTRLWALVLAFACSGVAWWVHRLGAPAF